MEKKGNPVVFGIGIGIFVACIIRDVSESFFNPERVERRKFGRLARKCGPSLRKELEKRIKHEAAKEQLERAKVNLALAESELKKFE